MIKKTIFFLAWLGIFVISILGIGYIAVPKYFLTIHTDSLGFKLTVLNVSLVYLFITLLKLVSNFSSEKGDYIIKNENGSVRISTATVKNLIRDVLSKDKDIRDVKIECGNRGKKYFVKINVTIISDTSIAEKTADIQTLLKDNLEDKLDLKVDYVDVEISKLVIKKSVEA